MTSFMRDVRELGRDLWVEQFKTPYANATVGTTKMGVSAGITYLALAALKNYLHSGVPLQGLGWSAHLGRKLTVIKTLTLGGLLLEMANGLSNRDSFNQTIAHEKRCVSVMRGIQLGAALFSIHLLVPVIADKVATGWVAGIHLCIPACSFFYYHSWKDSQAFSSWIGINGQYHTGKL